MRFGRRISVLVILGVAIAVTSVSLWGSREPRYGGKTLSEWLPDLSSELPQTHAQAIQAVQQIGTNAVSFIVARLRHQDSPIKLKMIALARRQSLIKFDFVPFNERRHQALAAFDALGPAATAALPALEESLYHASPDPAAPYVMARIGPVAIPVLTRALTNGNKAIRLGARASLDLLDSHSELLIPQDTPHDFMRRISQYNVKVLHAAFLEYQAAHPEAFSSQFTDKPPSPALSPEEVRALQRIANPIESNR